MEITVNIPDELVDEARAHGVTPEAYVEAVLARQVGGRAGDVRQRRTPDDVAEWIDSLAQLSERIPPLPARISREWIYQDHD
jgi:hypothetical protein